MQMTRGREKLLGKILLRVLMMVVGWSLLDRLGVPVSVNICSVISLRVRSKYRSCLHAMHTLTERLGLLSLSNSWSHARVVPC